MAERRPKAKSQGMKNRLGASNTCVSEVAARHQPVKAGSWKGDNPSEMVPGPSGAHAHKDERKGHEGRRCGEKPHDCSAERAPGE